MRVALHGLAAASAVAWAACGGPQIQERKVADLAKLGPATLEATRPKDGDPRAAKVRVWADAGVRALPRWKEKVTDQLDYASQLLTPLVGVRLDVASFHEWDRTGAPEPTDALRVLAEADDGKGAAWVIGYITPPDTASKAMDELGAAELLGRHVVVRAWAEAPENAALAPTLPELAAAERNEVLASHERHKQAVVLLHMLGRTLGAIGDTDPTWIQNPIYSSKQATVSDRNRELMQLSIDHRLSTTGAKEEIAALAAVLLDRVDKENWGGWIGPARDETVAQLRAIVNAGKQGQAAPDVPVAAVEQFERIKALAQRGDLANAMTELDNLLVAYPGNATMHLLRCELHLVKPGVKDKATRAACARVSELAPGEPAVHFAIAEALVKIDDIRGAREQLKQAATKIANLTSGGEAQWKRLVAIYHAMGALTWTEEAIAAGKLEDEPIAAEVAATRARYGVPKGTKAVKPEDEAAFVAAVKNALGLINSNKHAEAGKVIANGERRWRGAPGFPTMRCDLELRRANLAGARAACQRALAIDPNASWALYLSGVIELKNTSAAGTRRGIDKLKQAIAADPELGQAWRTLAKAYVRAKDTAALEQLAKDYQAKFGTPLPR